MVKLPLIDSVSGLGPHSPVTIRALSRLGVIDGISIVLAFTAFVVIGVNAPTDPENAATQKLGKLPADSVKVWLALVVGFTQKKNVKFCVPDAVTGCMPNHLLLWLSVTVMPTWLVATASTISVAPVVSIAVLVVGLDAASFCVWVRSANAIRRSPYE